MFFLWTLAMFSVHITLVRPQATEPYLNARVDSVKAKHTDDPFYPWYATPVSFFQVLGNPDFYDGRKIMIKGYLHTKFEDIALYFSKDCADRLMDENAVWVHWKVDSNNVIMVKDVGDGEWVSLTGIFRAGQGGHRGSFPATLDSVYSGWELTRYYNGSKKLDPKER